MKKILVGAAVGTAGLVALTGATFAQSEGEGPGGGVRERVAEILGIAPEELQDAVKQARDEQRDEQIAERLASAVGNGIITKDEADDISAWLDSMPEAIDGVGGRRGHGVLGHFVTATASEEQIAALIERLVASEKITEAEAVEVGDWLGSAPTDALAKLGSGDGDHGDHGRRGRGFNGRMFGEGPDGRLFEGRFQIRPYIPPVEVDETEGLNTSSPVAVGELI